MDIPKCLTVWDYPKTKSSGLSSTEELKQLTDNISFYTQFSNNSIPSDAVPKNNEEDLDDFVSVGGKLNTATLLEAYAKGIFPWYETPPILWHCPFWRAVLLISSPLDLNALSFFKLSKNFKTLLKKHPYTFSFDQSFEEVIEHCGKVPRKNQNGTWINPEMITAYIKLHEIGIAHSVEVRLDGTLVGGLYGLSLGKAFFGESMFSLKKDTSKLALHHLYHYLEKQQFLFIDCQMPTEHLSSLGAITIKKPDFLSLLTLSNQHPTILGPWE